MNTKATEALPAKLIACVLAIALIVLGVIGLVLPLIPGLLLLVAAAVIVARYFPSIDGRLRESRIFGRHMEWADVFFTLPLREKIQLGALVSAKVLLDSLTLVGSAVMRVVSSVTETVRRRA